MARRSRRESRKRTRLNREEIRERIQTPVGGGSNWFTLPQGVETWAPEKPMKVVLDVVPYETTNHLKFDKKGNLVPGCEAGVVWFRRFFRVHHGVGPSDISVICPTSVGEKCPICEEMKRLSKEDYEENKAVIGDLRGQRWAAFNILDPEDPEKVRVFVTSVGKFNNLLEQELEEADDDDLLNFFDVTEMGKSLRVRFSEDSYAGSKFVTATKLDFVDREAMDEEEIFSKTVNLDEIFIVLSYEKLQELFLQESDGSEGEDDDDAEEPKPKPRSRKAKKEEEDDEAEPPEDSDDDEWDGDDWDDGDDDWDDDPDSEGGDEEKPKGKSKSKLKPDEDDWDDEGGDPDDDEDWGDGDDDAGDDEDWGEVDDEDWGDDSEPDDEEPTPSSKKLARSRPPSFGKKTKPKKPMGNCLACDGTGESSRGGTCSPCKGTGSITKKKAPPKAPPSKGETKPLKNRRGGGRGKRTLKRRPSTK